MSKYIKTLIDDFIENHCVLEVATIDKRHGEKSSEMKEIFKYGKQLDHCIIIDYTYNRLTGKKYLTYSFLEIADLEVERTDTKLYHGIYKDKQLKTLNIFNYYLASGRSNFLHRGEYDVVGVLMRIIARKKLDGLC